jgi:hypothetical protein
MASSGRGPWSGTADGPGGWWLPGELDRIRRHNDRIETESRRALAAGETKRAEEVLKLRVLLETRSGHLPIPCQWAGNPWDAQVILLLMNPSYDDAASDKTLGDPALRGDLASAAQGNFDPNYPNLFLSPRWRAIDSWHPTRVFGTLHRHLVGDLGMDPEAAWKRCAQRVCVLELSPWASKSWTTGCWGPTAQLGAQLAQAAADDPDRVVLVGRGPEEWRRAGLLDVDLLEQSRGVRMNQVRISPANFPRSWERVLRLVS